MPVSTATREKRALNVSAQAGNAFDNIAGMKSDAIKILEEALKLPIEARAALAGSLIESLDEAVDENVEAAWADEIARRVEDLDSGRAKTIPWSKARRLILSR